MTRLPYLELPSPRHLSTHPTLNVLKLLSHSRATVDHWADVGNAQFKHLTLSKRDRELVILLSTSKFKSTYEWTHHVPISSRAGVTDEERDELQRAGLQAGYFTKENLSVFSARDHIFLAFLETIIEQPEVSDEVWKEVKAILSDREIVEIISLQGFYYTFSRLTTVLKVDMDDFVKAKL